MKLPSLLPTLPYWTANKSVCSRGRHYLHFPTLFVMQISLERVWNRCAPLVLSSQSAWSYTFLLGNRQFSSFLRRKSSWLRRPKILSGEAWADLLASPYTTTLAACLPYLPAAFAPVLAPNDHRAGLRHSKPSLCQLSGWGGTDNPV